LPGSDRLAHHLVISFIRVYTAAKTGITPEQAVEGVEEHQADNHADTEESRVVALNEGVETSTFRPNASSTNFARQVSEHDLRLFAEEWAADGLICELLHAPLLKSIEFVRAKRPKACEVVKSCHPFSPNPAPKE
jgi:hypothetical protein